MIISFDLSHVTIRHSPLNVTLTYMNENDYGIACLFPLTSMEFHLVQQRSQIYSTKVAQMGNIKHRRNSDWSFLKRSAASVWLASYV